MYRMILATSPTDVAATFAAAHEEDRFRPTAVDGLNRFVDLLGPAGSGRQLVLDELALHSWAEDVQDTSILDDWVREFAKATSALRS